MIAMNILEQSALRLGWLGIALLGYFATTTRASDDFEKHVRPLLVEKCQSCHGAETILRDIR